jgi:hypothetical protein
MSEIFKGRPAAAAVSVEHERTEISPAAEVISFEIADASDAVPGETPGSGGGETSPDKNEKENQDEEHGCECMPPLWKELVLEGLSIAVAALVIVDGLWAIGYMFSHEAGARKAIMHFIFHAFGAIDETIFWVTGIFGGLALVTSSMLSGFIQRGVCLPLLKFLFHCCALSIGCVVAVWTLSGTAEYQTHVPAALSFGSMALGLLCETIVGVYAAKTGFGASSGSTWWKLVIVAVGLVMLTLCGWSLRAELAATVAMRSTVQQPSSI